MNKYIIAVDGPSAAGKSCLAKAISDKLNIVYIDTGAMYRAVALYVIENSIDISNEEIMEKELNNIDIKFERINGELHIFLNGNDVSSEIRTEKIAMVASKVSSIKCVRYDMVDRQRKLGEDYSVILDGRDIGSVVFPNADLKIYLTASEEERAKRRLYDLEMKNIETNFEEVLEDIKKRDYNDINKPISPLVKTEDAVLIDTTNMLKEDVIDKVVTLLKERNVI